MTGDLQGIDPRALDLLRRRPRLIPVLFAIAEMIDGRRNCRVSVDVSGGAIRLFRETQERSISLAPAAPLSPKDNRSND